MHKKIFGPCLRVTPISKDLKVGAREGKAAATEVATTSETREEHDVTIYVYLTRTGTDLIADTKVEVTARLKVGGSTRNIGTRSYSINHYFEPPRLLIAHWNVVGNKFYYYLKIWECDTWPNPDDTILYITGNLTIPSGTVEGYLKVTFGENGDIPVDEGGFEGYFEVMTRQQNPGKSRSSTQV